MTAYEEIKPEFNRCYDKEFNQIFSIVDAMEQKLLKLFQVQNYNRFMTKLIT